MRFAYTPPCNPSIWEACGIGKQMLEDLRLLFQISELVTAPESDSAWVTLDPLGCGVWGVMRTGGYSESLVFLLTHTHPPPPAHPHVMVLKSRKSLLAPRTAQGGSPSGASAMGVLTWMGSWPLCTCGQVNRLWRWRVVAVFPAWPAHSPAAYMTKYTWLTSHMLGAKLEGPAPHHSL